MSEPEVIHVVESILPSMEDVSVIGGVDGNTKYEPETIIFQTDENGFLRTAQHGPVMMAAVPHLKQDQHAAVYPYSKFLDASKQYSSATVVGGAGDAENEMEVTTIHVLGLDETGSNMEVAYDSSLQVPMPIETLEVPVEAILTEGDDVQSVHIGDYATATTTVPQHQPMVIATTESQANCFVTVQDNQLATSRPSWSNNNNNKKSQLPTVTRMVQPSLNNRAMNLMRFRRSRMIADRVTSIPVADFKAQLNDPSDTVGKMELAPTSKKMMDLLSKKRRLFSMPGHKITSPHHMRLVTRHHATKTTPEEAFTDMVLKPLGYQPQVDPTKIKRITRRRRYPEAEEYQRKLFQQQMQQTFDNLVAESQKNLEAVFLENTGSLEEDEDQGNLQILVQAAESDSLETEGRTTSTGSLDQETVCVTETGEQAVDEALPSGDWLGAVQQFVIIVPCDPLVESITETVMTS